MLNKSTFLTYPFLVLLSTGRKSFENMGRYIQKSGRLVAKMLQPAESSFALLHNICQSVFSNSSTLVLIIDDTLIKKIFATNMRGTGRFYDTKLRTTVNAFRLMTAMITDGRCTIPIGCSYLFAKELLNLCSEKFPTKDELAKSFISAAIKLFPDKKIIVVADGLYATVDLLDWCVKNNIHIEVRMHSNRVVIYKGIKIKLRELAMQPGIELVGRQTARTISVEWHGLPLELTIVKRVDKHGTASIVFQAATYKAEPREHVKTYKKRWPTEKGYRTKKQLLGLGDCYSTDLTIQYNHVAAVLLSYALSQIIKKKLRSKTPEAAINALKEKSAKENPSQFIDKLKSSDWFYA